MCKPDRAVPKRFRVCALRNRRGRKPGLAPAPLPMHAAGRFNRNTQHHILCAALSPEKLQPAHRLAANTTGVMVLTKTRHFASKVQPRSVEGLAVGHYPVCGDPASRPGGVRGTTQTLRRDAEPFRLHFWRISPVHPVSRERVEYTAPPPGRAEGPETKKLV